MILTPMPCSCEGENELPTKSRQFWRSEGLRTEACLAPLGYGIGKESVRIIWNHRIMPSALRDLNSHRSNCVGTYSWKINENLRYPWNSSKCEISPMGSFHIHMCMELSQIKKKKWPFSPSLTFRTCKEGNCHRDTTKA